MPPIKPGNTLLFVFFRDHSLVKAFMMRVLQSDIFQPFPFCYGAVPYELHLRLMWDRLKIGMKDGLFLIRGFGGAVAIDGGFWVKCLI